MRMAGGGGGESGPHRAVGELVLLGAGTPPPRPRRGRGVAPPRHVPTRGRDLARHGGVRGAGREDQNGRRGARTMQLHLEDAGAEGDRAVPEVLLGSCVAGLAFSRLFIRPLRVSTEAGTISSTRSIGLRRARGGFNRSGLLPLVATPSSHS